MGRLIGYFQFELEQLEKGGRSEHLGTLWSGIVDSSLWEESGDVVKVFMTMLATKDADHICRLDAYRVAKVQFQD
jgi:hypothetical protein